jgi:hypothetical protein
MVEPATLSSPEDPASPSALPARRRSRIVRGLLLLAVLVIAATAVVVVRDRSTTAGRASSSGKPAGQKTPGRRRSSTASAQPTGPLPPALAAVQRDLLAAEHATAWPTPRPDFSDQGVKDNHGCAGDKVNPIAQCTFGPASAAHTLYLVGDSTSAAYLPSFVAFLDQLPDWKLVVRSDAGCPFSTMPAPEGHGLDPDAGSAACTAHDEKVVAEIAQVRPDLLVFTTVSGAAARIPGKQAELVRVQKDVGRIVVFPTSPAIKDPAQCATATSTPADCLTPIPSAYGLWLRNLKAVAEDVKGTFLDPTLLFCADGKCPVFVKTIAKTKDGVHMSVAYAQYLAPAIHELFVTNKLLP